MTIVDSSHLVFFPTVRTWLLFSIPMFWKLSHASCTIALSVFCQIRDEFLQSNIVDLYSNILQSDPNHSVQFAGPSNKYAVLILIPLIAIYRSFCAYCIPFSFNSTTFLFNSIKIVHSNSYRCSPWSL